MPSPSAAGIILTAAGITAANEAIFVPATTGKPLWQDFNWRIVPATAVATLVLTGLEKVSEPLGRGLAYLALLAVLIRPMGKAPSPIENVSKMLGI